MRQQLVDYTSYDNYNPRNDSVWGQGANVGTRLDPKGARLLSPNEFDQLDPQVQKVYGGYMGYLNAYARQQKTTKKIGETYEAVRSGTYEAPAMASFSLTPSTPSSRIPTAGGTTKGAGIPTTIHRDIRGNPVQELAGGGIVRDASGRMIPQTAEQLTAQNQLDLAIPIAQETNLEQLSQIRQAPYLRTQKELDTKAKSEIAKEYAKLTPAEKLARTQGEVTQTKIGNQVSQFAATKAQQLKLETMRENSRSVLFDKNLAFKTSNADLNRELAQTLAEMRIEQDDKRQEANIAAMKSRLEIAAKLATTEAQRKEVASAKAKIQEYELRRKLWIEQKTVEPGVFQDAAQAAAMRASTTQEVRRQDPKTGKWTIFDAVTKKFIRWE